MSANHQITFFHHQVFGNQGLVQSVCPRCREFVAASKNPGHLKIAEAAHVCPGVPVTVILRLQLKRSG